MTLRLFLLAVLAALPLGASTLPGFRIETLAPSNGFVTSIAIDSRGTIYYTSSGGGLFRLDGSASTRVATLPTKFEGNAGLLGMALLDDRHAAVHYTNTTLTREIVSRVDLTTGRETVLVAFINDITGPERPVSPEHHGGNPSVGADGSIYVGIGDFGGGAIAELPEWPAGKIWRIRPDGQAEQFARGVRN
ncbi:MAG TPA: PQQ-dependent sugar dehydrogenase, partial [Thermoanaerobaculia bacterium]